MTLISVDGIIAEYRATANIENITASVISVIDRIETFEEALQIAIESSSDQQTSLFACSIANFWMEHNDQILSLEIVDRTLTFLSSVLFTDHISHSSLRRLYFKLALRFLYNSSWTHLLDLCIAECQAGNGIAIPLLNKLAKLFLLFGNSFLIERVDIVDKFWDGILRFVCNPHDSLVWAKNLLKVALIFLEFRNSEQIALQLIPFLELCLIERPLSAKVMGLITKLLEHIEIIPECYWNAMEYVLIEDRDNKTVVCDCLSMLEKSSESESFGFVNLIQLGCSLTQNDLVDFEMNPIVFYCWSYETKGSDNPRSWGYEFIKSHPNVWELLSAFPPSESILFLMSAINQPIFLIDWIEKELEVHEISTLLFALSKAKMETFPEMILEFALFWLNCGNSVIVTNAYRLIRKLIRVGVSIDSVWITSLLSHVDECLTNVGSEVVFYFVKTEPIAFSQFIPMIMKQILTARESKTIGFHLQSLSLIVEKCPDLENELFVSHLFRTLFEPDLAEIQDVIVTFFIVILSPENPKSKHWAENILCTLPPDRFSDFADVLTFIFFYHTEHIPFVQDFVDTLTMIIQSETVNEEDKCVLSLVISIILLRARDRIDYRTFDFLEESNESDTNSFIIAGIFSAEIISGFMTVNLQRWLAVIHRPIQTQLLSVLIHGASFCMVNDYPEFLSIPSEELQSDWIYESPHITRLALILKTELSF
jgi:hypothetical protein